MRVLSDHSLRAEQAATTLPIIPETGGPPIRVSFGVELRGFCSPGTWHDRYTAQMLHVRVVPYPGGPFSDDLSAAATSAAVRAVLGQK